MDLTGIITSAEGLSEVRRGLGDDRSRRPLDKLDIGRLDS